MINVMNYVKKPMNDVEKWLDSQLWHACAGGMVQMPPLNAKVLYFPQGHAEHSGARNVDFGDSRRIPPYILCRVSAVKFMADSNTDEVYAKMGLLPLRNQSDCDFDDDDDGFLGFDHKRNENKEKPSSFAKTLTQSDANNGGGFSVPRYCAETIFPRLDYAAEPPVQTILVKDVHGQIWKFRHIYRGTPRRHLLTTGWSNFVNHKKLVAGDSIVFLRTDNGDLCVGIRRAKRGIGGGFLESSTGTDSFLYGGGFARFRPQKENVNCSKGEGKASAESVIEAANLAANGHPFEVVYYPRASTPEFCIKASTVKAAMRIQWCPGMRFKMAFETEDSSRISWFMGMISLAQVEDRICWPNSPWRLLQPSRCVCMCMWCLNKAKIGRVVQWLGNFVDPPLEMWFFLSFAALSMHVSMCMWCLPKAKIGRVVQWLGKFVDPPLEMGVRRGDGLRIFFIEQVFICSVDMQLLERAIKWRDRFLRWLGFLVVLNVMGVYGCA